MRLRIVAFIALICLAATANAQLGFQLGWNISGYKLTRNGTHESRMWNMGFNAGVVSRTPGKHVCLQASLLYSQKGATNNNNGAIYLDSVDNIKNKLNYLALSLPLLIKAPIAGPKCTFDFGAGPYLARLVSAHYKTKYLDGHTTNNQYKVGSASTDDFKGFDAGLTFYMGTRFKHFNMNLTYDLGTSDIGTGPALKVKNGCFAISMGVFL